MILWRVGRGRGEASPAASHATAQSCTPFAFCNTVASDTNFLACQPIQRLRAMQYSVCLLQHCHERQQLSLLSAHTSARSYTAVCLSFHSLQYSILLTQQCSACARHDPFSAAYFSLLRNIFYSLSFCGIQIFRTKYFVVLGFHGFVAFFRLYFILRSTSKHCTIPD